MTSKRTGEPWMSASDYGKSLSGLTVNLLVTSVEETVLFCTRVLSATTVYADPDFAVLSAAESRWMVHADHTYDKHPMSGVLQSSDIRGCGIELRLHNTDPDNAALAAREFGYTVLDDPADKPHGVREVFIVAPDNYIWVIDSPLAS